MKSLETKELEKLNHADLVNKVNDLRSEYSKLKSAAARGTLKKELGEIKTVRRNVARVLTMINTKKAEAAKVNQRSELKVTKKSKTDSTPREESKAKE
ncbi:MAG: 50S ribosomal protein L29 [Nitrososphaerales archaeon]